MIMEPSVLDEEKQRIMQLKDLLLNTSVVPIETWTFIRISQLENVEIDCFTFHQF